ncbi:unnamed protein product [Arctia plantaginis]|uniref:C2H2-type domain-containing protein n=1 Tax=Arctia plantaginis TaxID=874455 RepID=A0A8S1AL26_ARCPL|nr:unnamed protein product [Arctia plantaginis]CAB3248505.1 unnamed protein product [Arctia plantaginis]
MNPNNNWRNRRGNFNNFGGWNSNLDQGYREQGYYEEMDDNYFDNRFGWQNGRGGGPPQSQWGPFNPGPNNWGPPLDFLGSLPNMYAWGRGFGPTGPPIQHPKKNSKPIAYLIRCGVPKERLNNLPKDFLRLITPEFCGVCSAVLESFHSSRAHYASKGHFKKQNKWMAEHRNMMYQHPNNEAPLKSRDLYCELCDVQITSKVHADSHYDGKLHRAIVEGHKKPKNSSLLSKSMAGRVAQLIRRERKFIKTSYEIEKSEEELTRAKIQSELYCNICATSVTCTEQMTMHLNGKKHLAREKNHILSMMKCDSENEDKEDNHAEKAEKEEVVAETTVKEQGDEVNDKYDWGNGSGAWEEEEKQKEE